MFGSRWWLGSLACTTLLLLGRGPSPALAGGPFVLNENHPIVVDGQLFGGIRNTRWLERARFPKTRKGKPVTPRPGEPVMVESSLLQGTETFRLYGPDGFVGLGYGNKTRYTIDDAGNESYEVAVKPFEKNSPPWRVAINGDWNGLPRPFKEIKPQKLFSVDIDGDGKDEHIRVQTTSAKDAQGARGAKNASDAKGARNKTSANADDALSEIATLTFEMKGKTVPLTSIELDAVHTKSWRLMALDFDGDGKLELLLTTAGKEASVELYEIKNTKPVLVLATPPEH